MASVIINYANVANGVVQEIRYKLTSVGLLIKANFAVVFLRASFPVGCDRIVQMSCRRTGIGLLACRAAPRHLRRAASRTEHPGNNYALGTSGMGVSYL